jgi:hypothetical protein
VRSVRTFDEAATEATEAAAWYQAERPGLGEEFFDAVDAALDLIEQDILPLLSMLGEAGSQGAKRVILRRFPYDVVERQNEIIVAAFAHHSRKPGYWRDRLLPKSP